MFSICKAITKNHTNYQIQKVNFISETTLNFKNYYSRGENWGGGEGLEVEGGGARGQGGTIF